MERPERIAAGLLITAPIIALGLTFTALELNRAQRAGQEIQLIPTPKPTPAVGIDTFENFTNSDLQVVFPD